eukprot:Trichotokara_eunicae@DN5337_c0_g1_i2.p1
MANDLFVNLINIAVICGAGVTILPQVYKIYKSKSVEGISEEGYILQTISSLLWVSYNYVAGNPILTYADSMVVITQYLMLVVLYWNYTKESRITYRTAVGGAFGLFVSIVYTDNLPKFFVPLLGMGNVPCLIAARLPQIVLTYQKKDSGSLAAVTFFMMFCGNLLRIFTTVMQVKDPIVLGGHSIAACCNFIPFVQCMVYGSNDNQATKVKKGVKGDNSLNKKGSKKMK